MKIEDNRSDDSIRLKHIEFGECFLWGENDYKCMRMETESIDYRGEGIPCVVLTSGQMVLIGAETWVSPINAKCVIED